MVHKLYHVKSGNSDICLFSFHHLLFGIVIVKIAERFIKFKTWSGIRRHAEHLFGVLHPALKWLVWYSWHGARRWGFFRVNFVFFLLFPSVRQYSYDNSF